MAALGQIHGTPASQGNRETPLVLILHHTVNVKSFTLTFDESDLEDSSTSLSHTQSQHLQWNCLDRLLSWRSSVEPLMGSLHINSNVQKAQFTGKRSDDSRLETYGTDIVESRNHKTIFYADVANISGLVLYSDHKRLVR